MKIFNLSFFSFLLVSLVMLSCSSSDHFNSSETSIYEINVKELNKTNSLPPVFKQNEIIFRLKEEIDDYHFTPEFEISPEATMEPASGTTLDFSVPQTYVITAADGVTQQEYIVKFIVDNNTDYKFSFEKTEKHPNNNSVVFTDGKEGSTQYWDSGNPGFAITLLLQGIEDEPENYPTFQDEGVQGKGVKMITRETGAVGASFGAPMAAGNLFIGDFVEITQPDPREGVHFGREYLAKSAPITLRGHFKYKSGSEGVQVNNPQDSQFADGDTDRWDAYAILFKKQDQDNFLKGDHNFQDERIVALARIDREEAIESDEWEEFEIPFQFAEGQNFELNEEYMYTIVFSASVEGDLFNGAIGSTLQIDEVELITEASSDN